MSSSGNIRHFVQRYNQICQQEYSKLGFVRYKRTFARIIGETVQSFSLITFPARSVCSIGFAIQPLCRGPSLYLCQDSYRLDNFFYDENILRYGGWHIKGYTEESISDCIYSMLSVINMHIMPLFSKATNCRTALCEMLKLERKLDVLRKQYLEGIGCEDRATPWFHRALFDDNKYYMALKSNNMTYARLYLENMIDSTQKKVECSLRLANPSEDNSSFYHSFVDRGKQKLNKLQDILNHLCAQDMSFFDSLIAINESNNISYLSKVCPQLMQGQKTD